MEVRVFLFVNTTKIYHFKEKDSEIKKYPLCLRNISGDVSASNMKKDRIKWVCLQFFFWSYDFSFDLDTIDTSDIIDINKYLMKKHDIK